MQSLNRVKLQNGNWLESSSILRSKSSGDSQNSQAKGQEVQKAVVYSASALPNGKNSGSFSEVGFADFLDAPGIEALDFSQFSNKKGARILLHLGEGNEKSSIQISIVSWDGNLVFQGPADQGLFPTEWVFTLPIEILEPWSRITVLYSGPAAGI
jgi:hypothetical protein